MMIPKLKVVRYSEGEEGEEIIEVATHTLEAIEVPTVVITEAMATEMTRAIKMVAIVTDRNFTAVIEAIEEAEVIIE